MKNKSTSTLSRSMKVGFMGFALMLSSSYTWAQVCTPISGTDGASTVEGFAALIDGSTGSKWCVTNFSRTDGEHNTAVCIFRSSESIIPKEYFLTTGGDTSTFPERNWKTWSIFGANFASEEAATADAEGWELIDEKVNLSSSSFPTGNTQTTRFSFSKNPTKAYEYYKIEVYEISAATAGAAMQMSEFGFKAPVTKQKLTAIKDLNAGLWGDGKFANLVDNDTKTKWGGGTVPTWGIVKAAQPISPNFYNLITGNDTRTNPTRNWKTWQIYGGNFASDADATKDAEGWVLLDDRVNDKRLQAVNYGEHSFGFNVQEPTNMQYFKIELASTGGTQHQMSEFFVSFNAESFDVIRNRYYSAAKMFKLPKWCGTQLKEAYQTAVAAINLTTNVEATMQSYDAAIAMQASLTECGNKYAAYVNQINFIRVQLDNGAVTAAGKAILERYLNENDGPSAEFANGTYQYIINTLQLGTAEIVAETEFISSLMDQYADLPEEEPLYSEKEFVNGDQGFNAQEGSIGFVDNNGETKWCCNTGHRASFGDTNAWDVIFKTESPVKPVYYRLITGNDTEGSPSRNWADWKIYGANFSTPEEATAASDKWVLIDNKAGVGQDQLPGKNFEHAYFYLSENVKEAYEYYKVVVTKCFENGGTMQMGEIDFFNNGNLREEREAHYEDLKEYPTADRLAQKSLLEEYSRGLTSLISITNAVSCNNLVKHLRDLQTKIDASELLYSRYVEIADSVRAEMESGESFEFLSGYLNQETIVNPGEGYPNGSYAYIIANRQLDDSAIKNETQYILDLLTAAQNDAYIALSGSTGYNAKEGFAALIDGDEHTKWAGSQISKNAHCIFRTSSQKPLFYTLVVGGDTDKYPSRNWKSWTLYGGNFENDAAATQDAAGWTVIDTRADVTTDRIPAVGLYHAHFGITAELAEAYKYFKVEVTAAQSGDYIQMSELKFGDQPMFEEIRDEQATVASEYELPEVAEEALLTGYSTLAETLTSATDMETLMEHLVAVKKAQKAIQESATAYKNYQGIIASIKSYLEKNLLEGAEADLLMDYLEGTAHEEFPNGTSERILDEHVLNIAQLEEETTYLNNLFQHAIETCYTAGADLTRIVKNADFAKGFESWEGTPAHGYETFEGYTGAEGWEGTFDMHQTFTGLKNGLYELKVNAGYRPSASYTDEQKNYENDYNYAAYIYANDVRNFIMSDIEGKIAAADATTENAYLDMENDLHDITLGTDGAGNPEYYMMRGVRSVAKAIQGGRYVNRVMVEVTDGTLTIGIADPGTGYGTDWLGFGNVRLTYCGAAADATASLQQTLAQMGERAKSMAEKSIPEMGGTYAYSPNYSSTLRTALQTAVSSISTGDTMYDQILKFSDLFKQVRVCKDSYINATNGINKVFNKWGIVKGFDYDTMEAAIATVEQSLENGEPSAEQAIAAKENLYRQYPDYLIPNKDIANNDCQVVESETEPFAYTLTTTGKTNPSIGFSGFYENLKSDRVILAFDYISNQEIKDAKIHLMTDFVDSSREYWPVIEKTDEWKSVYIDVEDETLAATVWGKEKHGLVFYPSYKTAVNMEVRKFRVMTKAEMFAESGIDPDGIATVSQSDRTIDGMYNLLGQKVNKLQKGLYIINGRKYLKK